MRFESRTAYMFITKFPDATVEDLALGAEFNERKGEKMIWFWCGERDRCLIVKRIIQNTDDKFIFEDDNGYEVTFSPVTIEDYREYRDWLFINAPELDTTEEIQRWLMTR